MLDLYRCTDCDRRFTQGEMREFPERGPKNQKYGCPGCSGSNFIVLPNLYR